jgi:hypothetical protein
MATSPIFYERVHETTTTSGTGAVSLGGAVTGCFAFSVLGDGTSCDYTIVDYTTGDVEVGTGTYTASGDTLSRDKVRNSSNSGSLVSFASATTKHVFLTQSADYMLPDITVNGRLTLSSTLPVTTTDVTGAGTIYFLPFRGNRLTLWNGSGPKRYALPAAGLSLSLSGLTSGLPYDVFVYDAGTNVSPSLTLVAVAWTNATTRATALANQDGAYVLSGTPTKLYLGTFYTTGTGTTEDSVLNRCVWNYHNRVRRPMARFESTSTWTYASATFHQANGSTANQLAAVVGVAEVTFSGRVACLIQCNSGAPVGGAVSIGTDSTTTPDPNILGEEAVSNANGYYQSSWASLDMQPSAGYHYWAWLECVPGSAGTQTFLGNAGSPPFRQSGITGSIEG